MLGSVIEATIGGYRIKTQADGEMKMNPSGVRATANTTGSGETIYSGEVHTGQVTIPAYLYPGEAILLKKMIRETPDGGYPCTFTLLDGTVWGFSGTVIEDIESSIKDGKCDLTFNADNLREL